jgi:hypothetical protein
MSIGVRKFVENGTWTAPAGVRRIRLEVSNARRLRADGGNQSFVSYDTAGNGYAWGIHSGITFVTGNLNQESVRRIRELRVKQVVAGFNHAYVLDEDGVCWSFGVDTSSSLGIGTTGTHRSPVPVSTTRRFEKIAAGELSGYGLERGTGALYAWGANGAGQLGDGSTTNRNEPVLVSGGHTWVDFTAGIAQAGGITETGDAYEWGAGIGNSPTLIPSAPPFVKLFFGSAQHGILANGDLYGWGLNAEGQIGNNSTTSETDPVLITGISNVVQMGWSAEDGSTFAIVENGDLYSWGANQEGQLGLGDTSPRLVPTLVPGGRKWSWIGSSRWQQAIGVDEDNQIFLWGRNQLWGTDDSSASQNTPEPLARFGSGLEIRPETIYSNVVDVVPGTAYAIEFDTDGVTFGGERLCWQPEENTVVISGA